jgi:hypothetical protein
VNRPPGSGRQLAPYFPLPLVGAAVLLAILIVLTPNLLSTNSPTAGSLISEAELLIDRAPSGSNTTQLYLKGIGIARYASLELQWAPLGGPNVPGNLTGIDWVGVAKGNQSLGIDGRTIAQYFVVNASAVFIDASGAGATYSGAYACLWSGDSLYTTAYLPGTGSETTPLDQLPLTLILSEGPYGGGP